ncbi:ATP-binding protein Cassette (ABC) superfamily [Trypanosoma conorhini]|uniref:ATP-binding protein Cassette (ABC) superfamily n=1 Tax=Trypanosoma conorhini TaxID=83891 RepID=A0A422P258_9TRYP|nr:ATP-binding protein Cassette (ABC) superfamily [Trypanosoma conorhini]RNF11810.1 ATP-binding protein Cassette (ABC) superfamily [Trypanosoma conorhini]
MLRLKRLTHSCCSRLSPFVWGPMCGGRRGLLVGNSSNGVQPVATVDWIDIVGRDTSIAKRIAAGELLAMMDLCAKRVADVHLSSLRPGISCSTVGVMHTRFSSPVLHGDAVRMNGRIVFCGASSLGVYIRFFRQSPSTLVEAPAGESFFTMVAIDANLKALKVVPAVEITAEDDVALHERYLCLRQKTKEEEAAARAMATASVTAATVQCSVNEAKPVHVPISSSRTKANRIFLFYHLNNNRTIFGGELMRWMERHAVYCASVFTGNRNVYTVGMHSVEFQHPVLGTDWVQLEADVIYVHNTTMEVDVRLTVEREGRIVLTNRASFVLFNSNEIGQKITVPKGLDLPGASREELLRFAQAKERYRRRQNLI